MSIYHYYVSLNPPTEPMRMTAFCFLIHIYMWGKWGSEKLSNLASHMILIVCISWYTISSWAPTAPSHSSLNATVQWALWKPYPIHHLSSRSCFRHCTVLSTGDIESIKTDMDPIFMELIHKSSICKLRVSGSTDKIQMPVNLHERHIPSLFLSASTKSVALVSYMSVSYKHSSITNTCYFGSLVKSLIFLSLNRCSIYTTIFLVFILTLELWLLSLPLYCFIYCVNKEVHILSFDL